MFVKITNTIFSRPKYFSCLQRSIKMKINIFRKLPLKKAIKVEVFRKIFYSTWTKLIILFILQCSCGCTLALYQHLNTEKYEIRKYQNNSQEIDNKEMINWGVYGEKKVLGGKNFHHAQFGNLLKGDGRYLDVYVPVDKENGNIIISESTIPINGNKSAILMINVPRIVLGIPDIFSENKKSKEILSLYPQKILIDIQYLWDVDENGKIADWVLSNLDARGIVLSPNLKITVVQKDKEWTIDDLDFHKKYLVKEVEDNYGVYLYLNENTYENISAIFYLKIEEWQEEKATLIHAIKNDNDIWEDNITECLKENFKLVWGERSKDVVLGKNILWYLQHAGFLLSVPIDIVWSPIWVPYILSPGLPNN